MLWPNHFSYKNFGHTPGNTKSIFFIWHLDIWNLPTGTPVMTFWKKWPHVVISDFKKYLQFFRTLRVNPTFWKYQKKIFLSKWQFSAKIRKSPLDSRIIFAGRLDVWMSASARFLPKPMEDQRIAHLFHRGLLCNLNSSGQNIWVHFCFQESRMFLMNSTYWINTW